MGSLRYFLKEHARLNYSLDQIVEQYKIWALEALYMILTKWNSEKWKNDVYAVKCAKRGNDVYRSRVENRFRGLRRYSEDIVFFNPKDRGKKETKALWVTLTYDTKRCLYGSSMDSGLRFGITGTFSFFSDVSSSVLFCLAKKYHLLRMGNAFV